jgi:hypothetical protein
VWLIGSASIDLIIAVCMTYVVSRHLYVVDFI